MPFSVSYRIVSRGKRPLQCPPQSSAGLGYAFPVENVGYWKEVNLLHTQALGGHVNRQIPKTGDRSAPVLSVGSRKSLLVV